MTQIKIAPIVPFSIIEGVLKISNISLYLFHEIENPAYRQAYLSDENYKIMDNGTFELNKLPKDEDYIKAAINLKPNEIVTPDLLGNFAETNRRTYKFLNTYYNRLKENRIKIQAVIQADNLQDAINYYVKISEDGRVDCIGLPFKMKLRSNGRMIDRENFIQELMNRKLVSSKPHHLLGISSIQELIRLSKHKFIRSCDGSLFYRDARDGIDYKNEIPDKKSGSRIDLNCKEDKECLRILKQNLEIIRQEILRE